MSAIALGMNLLLAGLLAAALAMGWRLNRRLKGLRESQEGFAVAVTELNHAAARAERGLADLRAATDEAVDTLADRIEKGRALAAKLGVLINQASEKTLLSTMEKASPKSKGASAPAPESKEGASINSRLGALLAAAREARTVHPEARPERSPPPLRRRADDDLFEDGAAAAPQSSTANGGRRR